MAQSLTLERAEELIRSMTDGLVNIVDKTGEFLLPRESRVATSERIQLVLIGIDNQSRTELLSTRRDGKDGNGRMVSL